MARTSETSHQGVPMAELRARVDPFVRRRFGVAGALRLHGAALGWDLLRAPLNVMLAPFDLARRLAAGLLRRLGLGRAAGGLGRRPLILRTAVARRVEAEIGEAFLRPAAGGDPAREAALARWAPRALAEIAASRSAAAEIATLATILLAGALTFGAVSLGVVSLAPRVAEHLAREAAVAGFPLGERLGAMWYRLRPVEASPAGVLGSGVALALLASLVATFAGVVTDPLQARLGLHRRRLLRLLASLEAELAGAPRPFAARGPYLARLGDVADGAIALIRHLRP